MAIPVPGDGLGTVSGRWYACLRVNKSDVQFKRDCDFLWKSLKGEKKIGRERGLIDFRKYRAYPGWIICYRIYTFYLLYDMRGCQ